MTSPSHATSPRSPRWLLALCGASGFGVPALGAELALVADAERSTFPLPGDAKLADRTIIEIEPDNEVAAQRSHQALIDLAARRQLPLLTVAFSNGEQCRSERHTVNITDDTLKVPQLVTLLRPVLVGSKPPGEMATHVARRLAILALHGRPIEGHPITQALDRQLQIDRSDGAVPQRWWQSTVIDENTGEPVIERDAFEWATSHSKSSDGSKWPIGNAGVLHTYGYLLSTAWTPYGWKADRYLDGTLSQLLDIDPDDLTPWAPTGTVLSNLTTALDRLLASTKPRTIIEETGLVQGPSGAASPGTLRTRLFKPTLSSEDHLLVYTVQHDGTDELSGRERHQREHYVTAFPMSATAAQATLQATDVRARYNVAAELLGGVRRIKHTEA